MLDKSYFSVETVVANQGGAMEADTISKNGRSSKSHTSRENLLYHLFISFFVVSVTFTSCNKDDEGTTTTGSTSHFTVLDVKNVENRTQFDFNEVRLTWNNVTLATAPYSNNSFKIDLSEIAPQANTLRNVVELFKDTPLEVNNADASIANKIYIRVYQGNNIRFIDGFDAEKGSTSVSIWYSDSDVTITGSYTETDTGQIWTYTYNISLKKGWNFVYQVANAVRNNTYTTKPQGNLKWIIFN